jgi:hypothetical protein
MNQLIYERLKLAAKARATITYGELAPLVALDMESPAARIQLGAMLGEISTFERQNGRPLLSALVVHKEDKMPGGGFFTLAKRLGLYHGSDNLGFFVQELKRVHDYWAKDTKIEKNRAN